LNSHVAFGIPSTPSYGFVQSNNITNIGFTGPLTVPNVGFSGVRGQSSAISSPFIGGSSGVYNSGFGNIQSTTGLGQMSTSILPITGANVTNGFSNFNNGFNSSFNEISNGIVNTSTLPYNRVI
jgi:hypothetical protein